MNKIKTAVSILAIAFGLFLFVYGEHDDSPGGQLLGLVIGIASIVGVEKSRKKGGQITLS